IDATQTQEPGAVPTRHRRRPVTKTAATLLAPAHQTPGRSPPQTEPIQRGTHPNQPAASHPDNRQTCLPAEPAYSFSADKPGYSRRRNSQIVRRPPQTAYTGRDSAALPTTETCRRFD